MERLSTLPSARAARQPSQHRPGAPKDLEREEPTEPMRPADARAFRVARWPSPRGPGPLMALAVACAAGLAHAQDTGVEPELVNRDEQGQVVMRDDAAGFGAPGQWAFSTDATLAIERRTQSHADATTSVSIFPAADYFVIENLSIGGVLGVGYTKAGSAHSTIFRLGPRIGYNLNLSELLSVWPKLGIGYAHTKADDSVALPSGDTVTRTVKNDAVQLNLFAPVMLHPAPHFFAGFGPFVDTDLNGDNRATTWGLRLTLGGWL